MKNKFFFYSLFIFIFVVLVLGISFSQWGFKTDDFGNIFHCKIYGWQTIKQFFTEGSMEGFNYPSNAATWPQAFFCGLYRPMSFLYYYAQYYFFQDYAFGYFLVTVMFHAFNAAFLFYIFSYIFTIFFAVLAALLFAFHPSLWNWLGWISAQTYFIELFVLLLLIFLLKKYLDTKNIFYYLGSCFLFLSNVFLKEATVVLPVWIVVAVFLYVYSIQKSKINFFSALRYSFLVSIGYWLVSIFYCLVRVSMFPLTSNTSTLTFEPNLISFVTRMKSRMLDFVAYGADMLTLTWMPGNNRLVKGSIIVFLLGLFVWLFIKSTKKKYILFCLFSVLIFSWPALLMHYQPRYIYMAIPFFILMIFLLFESFLSNIKKYISYGLIFLIGFYATFLFFQLKKRETILHQVTQSFRTLLENKSVRNRPLCFMGIPEHWFPMGTAQAVWLLTGDNSYPVYQFGPVIHLKNIKNYLKVPAFDKQYLQVTHENNIFIFTSLNSGKLWFERNGKKMSEISNSIPSEYVTEDLAYITWDYQKAQFQIIK